MKFSLTQHELMSILNLAKLALGKNKTIAVVECYLIEANGQTITFTAYDTQVSIKIKINSLAEESGRCCVNGNKLNILVNNSGAELLQFHLKNAVLHIRYGNSKNKLQTLPFDIFPYQEINDFKHTVEHPANELAKLLKKAVPFTGKKDVRHYLNGVYLEIKPDEIIATGTNGHSMITIRQASKSNSEASIGINIPNDAISIINKLLDEIEDHPVQIQLSPNSLKLSADNIELTTSLIEGNYPYTSCVLDAADKGDYCFGTNRQHFIHALKHLEFLIDPSFSSISLQTDTNHIIELKSCTKEHDEGEEKLTIEKDYKAIKTLIAFNYRLMMAALNAIEENIITIRISTKAIGHILIQSPQSEDCKCIVMPMKQ